jgi:hypothetical protein
VVGEKRGSVAKVVACAHPVLPCTTGCAVVQGNTGCAFQKDVLLLHVKCPERLSDVIILDEFDYQI